MPVYADRECWEFKKQFPREWESYGCGPGDGIGDKLIPDTVWLLSIRDACKIHDWGYRHCVYSSSTDRERHDKIFLNNMLSIVDENTRWRWLRKLRYRRCKSYFLAVRAFGARSYWEARDTVVRPEEI